MDPISLDSIVITEDVDGSGGFDLNLVDPPEEFSTKEIEVSCHDKKPNSTENETVDEFDGSTSNAGGLQLINNSAEDHLKNEKHYVPVVGNDFSENSTSLFQENYFSSRNGNIEIENDDILITLDNDMKNGVTVDLFGFDGMCNSGSSKATPVNTFNSDVPVSMDINIHGNDQKKDYSTAEYIQMKKTIHPDVGLLKTKVDFGKNNIPDNSYQTTLNNDDIDEPDVSIHRYRSESSSDSEFDFELPPVKRKIEESVISNNKAPLPLTDTNLQTPQQNTVVVETVATVTSKTGVILDVNSLATTTKKIIEYRDESIIQDYLQPSSKTAADDWENVQTIEAGFIREGEEIKSKLPESTPLLSYFEMQETVLKTDFTSVKSNIHTTVDRSGFSAIKHFLFGPPKMHRNLLPSKETVFCIAASSFNNSNSMHTRALQTVYRCLTGSRFDCSRFGSHWEEIGFQGTDPSTDLRGAGLLGLMNLIYLLRDPKCHMIAKDIYKLSLHPTQNFPFCVMGINMSRITLQSLREDCLNKECNKRKDVLSVVNDFYAGIYLQLYQIWKSQGKTITDSGYVIKHLETEAKKNPHHVLKNLEDYLKNKKSSVNLDNMDLGGDNFLSVCETEAGQY